MYFLCLKLEILQKTAIWKLSGAIVYSQARHLEKLRSGRFRECFSGFQRAFVLFAVNVSRCLCAFLRVSESFCAFLYVSGRVWVFLCIFCGHLSIYVAIHVSYGATFEPEARNCLKRPPGSLLELLLNLLPEMLQNGYLEASWIYF